METVKRAAIYCRVSTEEQAKFGLSVGAQLASLREYCGAHEMKICGEYLDEGISGQKPYTKRPAMLRLLNDVDAGLIDIIVFIKLDRWFRSTKEYYRVQDRLDRHKVEWVAILEEYNTNTSSGRLNLNVRLAVAQAEAETTSDRIRFVFADKIRRGEVCTGKVPYGYKIVDKHMVIDEEKAPAVRWIYKSFLEGRSVTKLAEELPKKYDIHWCLSNVAYVIKNPKYKTGGLIDPDTWDACQKAAAQRAPKCCSSVRTNTYLFGAVYCSCGRKCRSSVIKGIPYYNCPSCHKYYRESKVEKYVLDMVADEAKLQNLKIGAAMKKPKQQADAEKYRKKLSKLVSLYLNDMIEIEEYQRQYDELQQKIKDCSHEEEPPKKLVNVEAIEKGIELYEPLSKENKAALWNRMIQRIDVSNGSYKITFI